MIMERGAVLTLRTLVMALLSVTLLGCAPNDMQDLTDYIEQVKSKKKGRIEPLPEIKQIETYVYEAEGLRDPFSPGEAEGPDLVQASNNGIAPDPLRRKEELEAFPLDSIRMVGTLEQKDSIWGLVTTSEGTIFRVRPGNYMGQNNGQITRVSEEIIELTEIVSDGQGGYRERQASVALNE
jgi:type IV pilus assembly protein PilP